MSEQRLSNIERRLSRLEDDEPKEERGILELFGEEDDDEPDEDAPLARERE